MLRDPSSKEGVNGESVRVLGEAPLLSEDETAGPSSVDPVLLS
jgi:hypothetical protein